MLQMFLTLFVISKTPSVKKSKQIWFTFQDMLQEKSPSMTIKMMIHIIIKMSMAATCFHSTEAA